MVCGAAVLLGAGEARAQFARRLYAELDVGVGTMLSTPQSDEYGLGVGGGLRAGLRIAGPLGIHLMGSTFWWSANTAVADGTATLLGGGLRVHPWFGRGVGGFFLDAEVGAALTGADNTTNGTVSRTRLGILGGVGWLFGLGENVGLGPMVRVGTVLSTAEDDASGRSTAVFWNAGIALSIHGSREEPPPPPPPPPTDTDGDGIMDPDDRCVTEPENRNGFEDTDGCPDDPDSDSDGVRDSQDRCPQQPEDRDNYQDEDGCPDPDNDGDGVPDTSDRCRDQPETRNGFEDDDGCPDEAPPTAVVEDSRISINQTIHFQLNRAVILPESFPILDQVVSVLQAHPEIRRISVEGHADDRGTELRNRELSQRRARAVAQYLRSHGVARGRVTHQGFGSTRPIAQGDTEEAHAQNRRVEFVIGDRAAPGPAAAPDASERPARGRRGGRRRRR